MYKQLTILATSVALLGSFAAFAVAKDLDVQAAEDKLRNTLEKVETKANPNIGDQRQQVEIPNTIGFIHIYAFLGISIMSFFTAKVGAKVAHILSPQLLKKCFALLLTVVGCYFLYKGLV